MLLDFVYHHQSASEVSPHCTHRWRKKVWNKQIHPRFGLKKATPHLIPSTNLFCLSYWESYLECDPGYWKKCLPFWSGNSFGLEIFPSCIHESIFFFTSFGIYIQSPFPPKKQLSKDLQTILSGHKSCSFFFLKKISCGPGRSISLEENDRIRSEADSGGSDSETCTGWCWRVGIGWDFCFLKMSVGGFSLLRRLYFFFQIPSILSILSFFLWDQLVKKMAKTQSMVFENVCWQHVMMEPKNVVTQDLVQVLMTAWDEFGCCPADTDMDGHFGLAKCKCFEPQVQLQQEAQCGTVEVLSWWRCILLAGSKPSYPVTIDTDQRFFAEDIRNVVGTAARQTGLHSWCSTDHVFVRVFALPLLLSCCRQGIQEVDGCPRWIGHWRAVQSPPWNSARCHFHGHWCDFGQCEWHHILLPWFEGFWTFDFSHTGGVRILLLCVQAKQLGFGPAYAQRSCRKGDIFFFPKTRSKWAVETGLEECNPSDAAGRGFPYSLCGLQRAKEIWTRMAGWNCFQWCRGRLPIGFASNVHSVLHGAFQFPSGSLRHIHQHCIHHLFVL